MADIEAIRARAEAVTEARRSPRGLFFGGEQNARSGLIAAALFSQKDIPDLLAVIDRVRELHRPETQKVLGMSGPVGVDYCGECGASWPCPTILAVDGDS